MHDGAVGPGAGDGREAEVAEMVALGAKRLELVGSGDLAEPALGRARREPGEEARQRRAVAAMGDARAIELGLVLARLGSCAGSAARWICAPAAARRSNTQAAALAGSTWTRRLASPRRSSVSPNDSGGATRTALPRCSRRPGASLRGSMKRSTVASLPRMAKASGSGVCGTSPPRMLSSQAI